ncbi:MAG: hypothetical protein GQ561_03160 [Calditrichae bacterium]|nr:hypothetical protein [Calditrichia bacterium]
MIKIKLMLSLFITLMLNANYLMAQSNASEWDYVIVREDIVIPSLTKEYEAALADLKLLLAEGKVMDYSYNSHLLDNYHFVHMTPLKKLEDIEKGGIEYVADKVNKDEFDLIWSDLAATTKTSWNYLLRYRSELSYTPESIYWGEMTPYRRWNYFYFSPGTEKDVEKLIMAWKTLYEQKNVNYGFRVFSGFIGVERPLYIFTSWAESPLDYQNNLAGAIELLGDKGAALWAETMNHVSDVETVEGWFLPQYSYVPE